MMTKNRIKLRNKNDISVVSIALRIGLGMHPNTGHAAPYAAQSLILFKFIGMTYQSLTQSIQLLGLKY